MKVSLNWLKQYVDITLSADEVANRLTMAGTEVKGVESVGSNWENIVVGQITAINPHPNADRLTLPTVDLGTSQETVVCGAPNLKVGDKVVFARVEARLIDPQSGKVETLKSAKIRGVFSSGMVCSERELGISDRHEGIMVLPAEAPMGTPLADYLGDSIFNMDVTPNRPDCLSMIGIAREIAALTGQSVHLPDAGYEEADPPVDQQIAVEIKAPDLCPRYCASLIRGVKIGESPGWMQERLLSYGMRPINNIVDVTNYVMLEYGQPLHAFDYEWLKSKKIIVRRADDSEVMVTLDDVERNLSGDMLVIADGERSVAVAGVMGGANSEVTDQTTSILLESASFNPASIHYTGRTLGLASEACMRFERGISPELTMPALRRATQLIAELGGGKAASGVVDVYPGSVEPKPITLSAGEVKRCLGVEFSIEQMLSALTSLGFDCKQGDSEVTATAPYWRTDINLPVDLVEEVARVIGYDEIPMTMLSQPIPRQNPEPVIGLKREASRYLAGYGFQEIISYSLIGLEALNKLLPETHSPEPLPLRMANPMTAQQEYLRPNLRASLLTALEINQRHEDGGIRLFELGRVYHSRAKDLPNEPEMLCGILSGSGESEQGGDELFDFFDAKGVVEGLLTRLGVETAFEVSEDETLRLGKQAAIIIGGNKAGVVGEVHPRVSQAFDISDAVYLFEIDLTVLLPSAAGYKMFQPIPRFPAIVRDMALVVDAGITHQKIVDIVRGFSLVSQVVIFDVYSGDRVPVGKKSLAYRVTFQSPTHTLTDKEVDKVQQQILKRLSGELGATLRS